MTKAVPSNIPPASILDTLAMLESIRDGKSGSPSAPACIVSFSGGKDSWAVLELAVRVWGKSNVHCYNQYIVPDLECELAEFRKVTRRYGIFVRRFPHPSLQAALRAGQLQPVPTAFRRKMQYVDLYELVRDITGSDWILFGHRMDESLQRRAMIRSSHGIIPHLRKAYPLWNWKSGDVFHFLKQCGIPAPEQYTEDDTTGLTLSANTLLYLRDKHPSDYAKIIAVFPLAEVQFLREAQRMNSGLDPTSVSITQKSGLLETLNSYLEGITGDEHRSIKVKKVEKVRRAAAGPKRRKPTQ